MDLQMSNKRGKQLNKYVPDYVLYDLETTGISANYDVTRR